MAQACLPHDAPGDACVRLADSLENLLEAQAAIIKANQKVAKGRNPAVTDAMGHALQKLRDDLMKEC